jgi:hypothetical protein
VADEAEKDKFVLLGVMTKKQKVGKEQGRYIVDGEESL